MSLPFVLLHHTIRLEPKAFVQLPFRFVPVSQGVFSFMLEARVVEEGGQRGKKERRLTLELRGEGR